MLGRLTTVIFITVFVVVLQVQSWPVPDVLLQLPRKPLRLSRRPVARPAKPSRKKIRATANNFISQLL